MNEEEKNHKKQAHHAARLRESVRSPAGERTETRPTQPNKRRQPSRPRQRDQEPSVSRAAPREQRTNDSCRRQRGGEYAKRAYAL